MTMTAIVPYLHPPFILLRFHDLSLSVIQICKEQGGTLVHLYGCVTMGTRSRCFFVIFRKRVLDQKLYGLAMQKLGTISLVLSCDDQRFNNFAIALCFCIWMVYIARVVPIFRLLIADTFFSDLSAKWVFCHKKRPNFWPK